MSTIKMVIIDDHKMIREGLKILLESMENIKVIAEADNGEEGLKIIEKYKPMIALIDINMPIMNGLQLLKNIKEKQLDVKTIMLTVHNESDYLTKAVKMGADGYVLKSSESIVLKRAIMSVNENKKYIQPDLMSLLRGDNNRANDRNMVKLSNRENEVLQLLAEGLFNKEIAYKLSISEKTVKNHVSNIFKKIGVSDRTQAAVYAIKNNIVDVFK